MTSDSETRPEQRAVALVSSQWLRSDDHAGRPSDARLQCKRVVSPAYANRFTMAVSLVKALPRRLWIVALASSACTLLEPYPGGDDAEAQLINSVQHDGGIVGSDLQILQDPNSDLTVTVKSRLLAPPVASEQGIFPIQLGFSAPNANVVGGGIRLPGTDEVQWTFLNDVAGLKQGELNFAFSVGSLSCSDVTALCRELVTEQFAVTRNTVTGDFEVSLPVEQPIVLKCASCQSKSCTEILAPGQCIECNQPQSCVDLYNSCYAPGMPKADATNEVNTYFKLFGPEGIFWITDEHCLAGEPLCREIITGNCEFPQ